MLKIRESTCQLGKFSNNLDKHGETDWTSFDVPVCLELKGSELNSLTQDKTFYRRVFDTEPERGKPIAPSEGFARFMPFKMRDEFEEVHVELLLGGKTSLEFENCRISKVSLEPGLSGTTECHFSLHLKPANDREILQLLHNQRREAQISISGGKVVFNKRQQELELEAANPAGASSDAGANGEQPPPPKGEGPNNVLPIR